MKLNKIKIENFIDIQPASFETDIPADVTVLVGKNGCGKSILLEQIAYSVNRQISPQLNEVRLTMDKFGNSFIETKCEAHFDKGMFGVAFTRDQNKTLITYNMDLKNDNGKILYFPPSRDIRKPNTRKDIKNFDFTSKVCVLDAALSTNFESTLVSIGDRHIQAEYHQMGTVPETVIIDRIKSAFNKLLPNISLIGTYGHEFLAEKNGQKFSISNLSHGEKQALLLFSFIAKEPNLDNSIVIIDEPDIGLSKSLRENLVPSLKELNSNMQIIVATHSQEIINSVPSENVIILSDL